LILSRWERDAAASPGPHDAEYLFDRFLELVGRRELRPAGQSEARA
jgi:hypothetical protein